MHFSTTLIHKNRKVVQRRWNALLNKLQPYVPPWANTQLFAIECTILESQLEKFLHTQP